MTIDKVAHAGRPGLFTQRPGHRFDRRPGILDDVVVGLGPDGGLDEIANGLRQRRIQRLHPIKLGGTQHLESGPKSGRVLTQLPNTMRTTAFARRVTRR